MVPAQPSLLESPAGSWLASAVEAVVALARLPPNWDGHGSPALTQAASQTAVRLLLEVALDDPPEPRVCPVPGGGLQLEWQTAPRELELEILPDGSVEFLMVEGGQMQEGSVPPDHPGEVRRLVGWLKE